jgi:hypothetical protein
MADAELDAVEVLLALADAEQDAEVVGMTRA